MKKNQPLKNNNTGFTLIELLIVIAIIAILFGVAYPTYQRHILRAQRNDAQTTLTHILAQSEQFSVQNNNNYPADINAAYNGSPPTSNFYTFSLIPCPGGLAHCVQAQATAQGSQLKDTDCKTMTIDTNGTRTAVNEGGTNSTNQCWTSR